MQRREPVPPAPPAGAAPYTPGPDVLDPGFVIVRAIEAIAASQLAAARAGLLEELTTRLLTDLHGAPRVARPAEVLLCFAGDLTGVIPADATVTSPDGCWTAVRRDPKCAMQIRVIERIEAVGPSVWDVTAALRDGGNDTSSAGVHGWQAVNVELSVGTGCPGLVWDLPAPVAVRIESVRSGDGAALDWSLDHRGCLVVPPQPMQGAPRIEIRLRVAPGELAHLGQMWCNAVPFGAASKHGLGEEQVPDAGTFTFADPRFPGLSIVQPFDGTPGRPAEDVVGWRQRVAAEARHNGRAVVAADFRDLVRASFPAVVVRAVRPTRARIAGRCRRAVQLVLTPSLRLPLPAALDLCLATGRRIQQFLADRVLEDVAVIAGPPTVRVPRAPTPAEPLWPYTDLLVDGARTDAPRADARRADATFWPVFDLEEFGRV
ncbi:MAG: hypothetical protein IPM29_04495 [Planctomycetes bacterium]|nr:hypothetical protein [Planctomycetota bacterium]